MLPVSESATSRTCGRPTTLPPRRPRPSELALVRRRVRDIQTRAIQADQPPIPVERLRRPLIRQGPATASNNSRNGSRANRDRALKIDPFAGASHTCRHPDCHASPSTNARITST